MVLTLVELASNYYTAAVSLVLQLYQPLSLEYTLFTLYRPHLNPRRLDRCSSRPPRQPLLT